ncbi:MAG: aminotransferase class III-fold pyridoxal phosphate-dependent enzyme, partial [Candidatus Thorarchaeota archaeon]
GFGRTGKLLASEHWGLKPDVMTLAKGMGGGIPIGACIGTDKIAAKLESGDFFSTYGGNPITSAISLANINYIQEAGLVENSVKVGKVFMEGLEDLQKKKPLIGDVRGKGLMIGIELVKDLTTKEPAKDESKRFVEQMKNDGVLIGLGGIFKNVLRLQPPLVITEEQAKTVLNKMDKAFAGL